MKAVGAFRPGGPDVLEVVDLQDPHAGPGEVRVRVRAAGVSPADTLIRAGASPIRFRPGRPVLPGLDIAGTVDEVGPGTTSGLAAGDDVIP